MRGWMRPLILSALILGAAPFTAGSALAQSTGGQNAGSQNGGKPAAGKEAPKEAPKTVAGSAIAQAPFAVQPFPLQDDGTYKEFLGAAAADLNRRCTKQENYGWEFKKDDDARRDQILESTLGGFRKAGWKLGEVKVRSVRDPGTTAYTAEKAKQRLLAVWTPMEDAAILLLCETEAAPATKK
ncbi:hypothetical protein FBZ83_105148 [Azospirillum brasilense]|uniref:Secreted protein n=1 Tax=Azospirillum brasilense TaxID=192 RepID=A0A560CHD3_AZOBR|nr:hypothetical protein [Azospirillum brasilense]MBK3732199.1 hypothetical protein [Azospirillum brasilense]TWA84267.1 hypothetical protein FBZ83_105148 [Azospirillum brasilense]